MNMTSNSTDWGMPEEKKERGDKKADRDGKKKKMNPRKIHKKQIVEEWTLLNRMCGTLTVAEDVPVVAPEDMEAQMKEWLADNVFGSAAYDMDMKELKSTYKDVLSQMPEEQQQ